MDNPLPSGGSAKAGTVGGLLLVLLSINRQVLVETVVLAAAGAIVSFTTSMVLKWLVQRWRIKKVDPFIKRPARPLFSATSLSKVISGIKPTGTEWIVQNQPIVGTLLNLIQPKPFHYFIHFKAQGFDPYAHLPSRATIEAHRSSTRNININLFPTHTPLPAAIL